MDVESFRKLIGIGAVAWNLTLVKDHSVNDVAQSLEDLDEDSRDWLESIVSDLTARKELLFPEDRRFIASWEVSLMPDGNYFVTAAGLGFE